MSQLEAKAWFQRETDCGGEGGTCFERLAGFEFGNQTNAFHSGADGYAWGGASWELQALNGVWQTGSALNVGPMSSLWVADSWNSDNVWVDRVTGSGGPDNLKLGTMTFEARVGDYIFYEARMFSYLITGGGGASGSQDTGWGTNDAFGTLAGGLTVMTPGVNLDWDIPFDAASSGVPEPGTLALAVCGAALSALKRLRRSKGERS